MYFVIKKNQKRGFLFHRPREADVARVADVARKADVAYETRADATLHARPRGRAARAHVRHRWCTGRKQVAGGHAGPRERPSGAMWQKGWQVKGQRVIGP